MEVRYIPVELYLQHLRKVWESGVCTSNPCGTDVTSRTCLRAHGHTFGRLDVIVSLRWLPNVGFSANQ